MRHPLRTIIVCSVVALLLIPSHCLAGPDLGYPNREETATTEPSFRGTPANAPIPVHDHKRNEGGSDGAGLCVICSLYINGTFQGIPRATLDAMWQLAKSRPGGYSPDKLQGLLDEVAPGEKWASYVGTDPEVLDRLSAMGYPIGSTMNTGELYGWRPIHHMVSLVHFDRSRDLACVVDNNRPGVYSWMSAREYQRRWIDGGTGWAFVWLRRAVVGFASIDPQWVAIGGLWVAVAALTFESIRRSFRRSHTTTDLDEEGQPDAP